MLKRVLYLVAPGGAGSNASLAKVIPFLIEEGLKICVVSVDENTLFRFHEIGAETHIIKFGISVWPQVKSFRDIILFFPRLFRTLFKNYISLPKLDSLVKEFRPDIIHTNVSLISIGAKVAKKNNIKHVWHVREYIDKDFGLNPLPNMGTMKKRLQNNYTITITKALQDHFNLDTNNRVIYNGIQSISEVVNKEKLSSFDKYFLFVGRVDKGKGLDDIVEALRYIQKEWSRDFKVLVAGSDGEANYCKKLRKKISSYGLENSILFLGQRHDVNNLMSSAVALVVPSVSEGFGRITAEAMFNNCIVIGKNTAGTKEQLDNGFIYTGNEIGFRYVTISQLASCIMQVDKASDEELNVMRTRAYETVKHFYLPEKCAKSLLDYYLMIYNQNGNVQK